MKDFIITHLLKTQDQRVIDMVFNRQKDVFGFGSNRLTLKMLGEKWNVTPERIRQIVGKQTRRIKFNVKEIIELAAKPAIIKEVERETIDRRVPINEMSIDVLDLSVRARNCLANEQIETINQLLNCEESYLLKIPNFGRISLTRVNQKLEKMGLKIGQLRLENDFIQYK